MSAHVEPSGHRDAVFGLARSDGRTLLVRNARVSRGGAQSWWDLPGGTLRAGESLPEALRREWREETGLEVDVGALRLVLDGVKRRPAGATLYTWRAFFFDAASSGTPRPGDDIEAVVWVPDADVAAHLVAPYHDALRLHLAGDPARYARVEWVEDDAGADAGDGIPRHLAILAAAAALGDAALLLREAEAALRDDVAPERIVETLRQVVPYAGYPRAITAFGAVRPLLDGSVRPDTAAPADPEALGRATFARVYGDTADAVAGALEDLDPLLARWTLQHAYGQVLSRDGSLTLRERELLAFSILTALGGLEDPLLGHMRAAVRLGADVDQVRAAVRVVPSAAGEGRRAAALALLARL